MSGNHYSKQTISAASSAATQAVLQALEAKEQQAQAALAQLGCCNSSSGGGSYDELYSTRLLRRATADPAAALAIVRFPLSERLQYLVTAVQRMAVLLRKYDSPGPTTSLGSAQEQLHAVVDALSECVIVAGLLDPPAKKLGNMLVNLETLEPEPYPQGYWRAVARNMQLTADQKAAFKLCWASVKANKAALTEQHSRLKQHTAEQQQQQRVYVPVITGVHRPAVRFELQQLHEAQASTSSGSAAALSRELSADATDLA
ncbi:hypothetical protein OEZ85_003248 [Tetradesmus obliquus]|uniref:Uncharacterized protein n=1 Tax=Tetradesmus obliquus TaxID=3088 RepID=A0ABY8U524_TETOB|nr:hypothetical protein OEZ85_003248 [Tetradesmus obliquus]